MTTDRATAARREALLRKVGERRASPSGIPRRRATGPAPLSYAQQRLWFLEQLDPGSARYNVPMALRLTGVLDVSALQRALHELVRRHEALRTRIDDGMAEPVQVVADDVAIELVPRDAAGHEVEQLAIREMHRPFDLTDGPLFRVALWRCEPEEHVLLVTMHHMVTDGWSVGLLTNELITLYRAYADGRPADLPEPRIQYADYAVWQREWLTGSRLDRHLDYWRTELDGAPAELDLSADRSRRPGSGNPVGQSEFDVDEHTGVLLAELGRAEGVTPHMTLLAAYALLLWRYTGQADLVVGTPVANRDRPELTGLVGFLVNMLPLRIRVPARGSFRELVRVVRRASLAAHRHQAVPFEKLVEELRPDRVPGRHPLFQAVVTLAHVGGELSASSGLVVRDLPLPGELAKFDVVLGLRHSGTRLSGSLAYNRDLFDEDRMRSMTDTFAVLLQRVAEDPERPMADLDLIDPRERNRLTRDWQGDVVPWPDEPVHRLFEDQARRVPDAVAVQFGDDQLTYCELDAWAGRIAHRLRDAGLGTDSVVAVHAERSLELVVGLLAALKAGAAFLPLDPEVPALRRSAILAEARPAAILSTETLPGELPPAGHVPVIPLDRTTSGSAEVDASPVHSDQLAYVVYTSGSTGRPKGAQNTHGGLGNRLAWMQRLHRLEASDAVLQKTPTSFDVCVWEFFLPLITGARLVLARPGGHRDPDHLAEVIARHGVTTIHFVPSMLRVFLEYPDIATRCASLRTVTCSGEALTADLRRRCHEVLPWIRVYNLYGPAEAAIDVTWHECLPTDDRPTVPIGRPIDNIRVYVCDEAMRLVPVGVPGELYLGGVGVGRGYLDRPDLTAERFLPDPFGRDGQRLYRTGDRVRMSTGGELEFLGRVDRQLKVRGVRVEPAEIEAKLLEHDGVDQVAVQAVQSGSGDQRLVAYIVPAEDTAAPVRRLLRAADADGEPQRHRLPNGMEVLHHNTGETEFTYGEIFDGGGYLRHGITVGPGDVVFDVGANIGLFSLFVAERWPDTAVYAFEPIPATFELLRRNLDVYAPEARAFACGLSDRARTALFTHYPGLSIMSGQHADQLTDSELVRTFAARQSGAAVRALEELVATRLVPKLVSCELNTVSQIMREHGVSRVDLLKVDVEKSEAEVLRGIEDSDWPLIRQVVVEVHDLGDTLADVTGLLQRKGFGVVTEQEGSLHETGLYMVYATRSATTGESPHHGGGPKWLGRQQLCDDVRAFAGQQLPPAMAPAAVVPLARMPLSANGKLDYKALPEPRIPRSGHRGPGTPVERDLVGIWKDVLQVESVGVDDDFFDLGGHSLLGLRLLTAVERRFGVRLPVAVLFERMTVTTLAGRIDAPRRNTDSSLVPLRPEGDQPSLFCVHAMDGTVRSYRDLIEFVDERVPVHGLRSVGPAGVPSVVDMATEYLTAARQVHSGGPWRLLGWSFGGLVAYEMARQLGEAGEQVDLLALVDTSPPEWFAERGSDESTIRAAFFRHLNGSCEHAEPLLDAFRSAWRAATTYKARPYPGTAMLFKTGTPDVRSAARDAWAQLCQSGVRLVEMSCDHFEIVKPPHVATVAAYLGMGEK